MRILPIEPKVQQHVPWAAWGRYPPHMRYNCDQVPFNLDNSGRKTYIKAQSDVAVISGQPGSEKRFGTLQVCLHAGKSSQPPLTIIFRGGGPKRFEREFPRYHPGVRVLWQPKAWMDSHNWQLHGRVKYLFLFWRTNTPVIGTYCYCRTV